MSYEAVIFDLDGTLLDTIEDLANSMNSVLSRRGFPVHGLDEYKYFVGDGMATLVRRALPESCRADEGVVEGLLNSMREEYGRRWKEKTCTYDGIPALLNSLTERRLKMAVLSNKPHDFTEAVVSEMLPRWRFLAVLGERPSKPRKPDPSSALEIAERLGIAPGRFLYVGDTGTDMQTATAAGMYAVGALWGFRKADELEANGARVLIRKPLELLELL